MSDCGKDLAQLSMLISQFPEQLMGNSKSAREGRKMNLHGPEM